MAVSVVLTMAVSFVPTMALSVVPTMAVIVVPTMAVIVARLLAVIPAKAGIHPTLQLLCPPDHTPPLLFFCATPRLLGFSTALPPELRNGGKASAT